MDAFCVGAGCPCTRRCRLERDQRCACAHPTLRLRSTLPCLLSLCQSLHGRVSPMASCMACCAPHCSCHVTPRWWRAWSLATCTPRRKRARWTSRARRISSNPLVSRCSACASSGSLPTCPTQHYPVTQPFAAFCAGSRTYPPRDQAQMGHNLTVPCPCVLPALEGIT